MENAFRQREPQNIRLAGVLERSTVNGPGVRTVIWMQGCPIRCTGCFNTGLWDFYGGKCIGIDQLFNRILSTGGIDGVTFSGGEPFAQAGALAELGRRLHRRDLTVVVFTGFSYDTLQQKKRSSWKQLLAETDLLISGPYIDGIPPRHTFTGSGNQEVRILTDRIQENPEEPGTPSTVIEYTLTRNGSLLLTGFPDGSLKSGLAEIGYIPGD